MTDHELFYAGVDGGGSKTLAIIVDASGRVRGNGVVGGANYAAMGLEKTVAQIYAAVTAAVALAGCALPLQAAWIGLAGFGRPGDEAALMPHLAALARTTHLTSDAALVLGALENAVGVALIAGTGSIALGRDAVGATARAGGWGHLLGDEGSGYAIGRECLRAVSRAADGRGAATSLREGVLRVWGLRRPEELIAAVHAHNEKGPIARLAPLAFEAARRGDGVAAEIVASAADELALAALTVGAALALPDALPLALAGGLLANEAEYRALTLARIQQQRAIGQVAIVARPAESAAAAARWLPTQTS